MSEVELPAKSKVPIPPMKWTLGDAFFFMTIFCVMFAVIGWVGTASPFLWMSLIVSLVLTGIFTFLLPHKTHGCLIPLAILTGIAFFGPLMMISLVIVMNCALHLVLLAIFGRGSPCTYKTALQGSLVCMAISFFAGAMLGVSGYHKLREARQQFSPVSLESRLAYEPEVGSTQEAEKTVPVLWSEMEMEQGNRRHWSRNGQLEGLHDERVESFIKSPGFGVARMLYPNPASLLSESKPPTISFNEQSWDDPRWRSYWTPSSEDFHATHMANASDFLDQERFGVATESGKRIGFVSHAPFHPPIENGFSKEWLLKSLQLVSLRRFDVPRAYVLDHLPRMDHLADNDAPTRDLDEFEAEALERLQNGEPFVVSKSEDGKQLVALGPLLAIDSCLECHSARRGQLLGAFSYEFQRRDIKKQETSEADPQNFPALPAESAAD